MPYFRRKPYSEMMADLRESTLSGAVPVSNPADEILELASGVLAEETRTRPDMFRLRRTLAPGDVGMMVLSLAQDAGAEPVTLRLSSGDLVGPAGRIPSGQVTLEPACVTLGGGDASDVRVTVAAPVDSEPGVYAGLLSSADDAGFSIPFEVPVGR